MLHTKLQEHRSTGSGVGDFQRILPYRCRGHIGQVFEHILVMVALNGIWLQLAQWFLRRCLKLSYYESPGSKIKQWPWLFLLINLSVLIKTTLITIFWPKH